MSDDPENRGSLSDDPTQVAARDATATRDGTAASPVSDNVSLRLEAIVETIQEYAQLHFDARAPISNAGDIVDAIGAGVNFLGEELAASFAEIERRVADRTEELTVITDELTRRALHDPLTGLPNRALFWDRLTHRLSTRDRRQHHCAVLFIDLDDFKDVNDEHGHAVGDELLVQVARRVEENLRAGDTAARFGGDEFVVLLDDVDDEEASRDVARRLADAIASPLVLANPTSVRITMRASLGIALAGPNLETPDALVTAADIAMYSAKHVGPGQIRVYENP